ncbi:MAG: 50S ribosomal protein L11 methyltransferase [Myxococcaceae bacterium]
MTSMWVSLTVDLPEQDSERLQDLLQDLGAGGLEVRDREAPPMPGVRGPTPGEAIVVAWFEDREAAEAARGEVEADFPGARAELEEVENKDWSESWKSLIRSVDIGRLWVGPPWLADGAPAGKEKIVIEPKMAFGTGDHPTTSLCLEAVDAYMAGHPNATVLDVGTGTGVLAIAAKRLGSGRTVGTDNDPMSVELAKENAALNATPDVDLSGRDLDQIEGTFDLVLANILANTLIELAPLIAQKVKDRLVLAGVLVHQHASVESAYVAQGLRPRGTKTQGEWIRIELERAA